jgi:hypothetical protein
MGGAKSHPVKISIIFPPNAKNYSTKIILIVLIIPDGLATKKIVAAHKVATTNTSTLTKIAWRLI